LDLPDFPERDRSEFPELTQKLYDAGMRSLALRVFGSATPSRPDVVRRLLLFAHELRCLHEMHNGRLNESEQLEQLSLVPAWLVVHGRILSPEFDAIFFHFARTGAGKVSKSSRGRMSVDEPPLHNLRMVARAVKRLPSRLLELLAEHRGASASEGTDLEARIALVRAILQAFGAANPETDKAFRFLAVITKRPRTS
jgi:hypothetical protein